MSIEQDDIQKILAEVNAKGARNKPLNEDEDLFKAGVLDSMAVVQFILALEKKYSIKIGKKDINLNNFSNIKNIKELIVSKMP